MSISLKRLMLTLGVLVLLPAGVQAKGTQINLVLNGDFENHSPAQVDGWDSSPASSGKFDLESISGRGEVAVLQAGKRNASVIIRQPVEFDIPGFYTASLEFLPITVSNGDELVLRLRFQDIFGNSLKDKLEWKLPSKSLDAWSTFNKSFRIPDKAASGLLEVVLSSKSGKGSVYLDNIVLRVDAAKNSEAAFKKGSKASNWSSEWIWVPGYTAADDVSPMYFRKTFNLADQKEVDDARVVVSADNDCQLFVNGSALPWGPNHDTWAESDVYDIKPYLRSGENVLAVKVINKDGPGGLILESGIHLRNRDVIYLKSDADWKCSKDGAGDWSAPGFDDTKWSKAESFGKPPTGAWGDLVSYTYLGPCAEIAVKDISCPASVQPGSKVPFRLTLSSKNKLALGTSLLIDLAKSATRPGISVYKKDLSEISDSGRIDLKGEFALSEYTIPGRYDIRISITNIKPITDSSTGAAEKDGFIIIPIDVLEKPKTAKTPVCSIKLVNGSPVLTIDGKTHTTMNYLVDIAGVRGLIENCKDNNIHIYWVNIVSTVWHESGKFDFSKVDEVCASVLAQDPDAYIVPIIPLDSVYNIGLKEWGKSHMGDMVRDSDGSEDIPDYGTSTVHAPSMASKNWLGMTEDLMRQLIRHIRSGCYADRVIGFMPSSGITYEWQQWGSLASPPVFVDYSESARQAFVDWSKKKYADIEKLNASWNTGYGSFDDIKIPGKDERLHSDLMTFIDPAKSMREVDYRRFYNDVVADVLLRIGRVVKEETNGENFCGYMFGYVTHVLTPFRYQQMGHSALQRVLESPYIDYLMSPSDYSDRQVGGGSGLMSATGSVRLHDKVWIDQADLRTHHSPQEGSSTSLADSKACMIRHFANALVNGCTEQLYDFSTGWTAGDKRLMQLAGKLREIEAFVSKEVDRSAEDKSNTIAVIVDEKSTYYTAMASCIHHEMVVSQYTALSRTGVGFDTYLLDDLDKIPDHRCYLFLNTFRITREQQALIEKKLKRAGKVLVFVYAPGITDEKSLLPERISDITGIDMEIANKELRLAVKVNKTDDPLLKYLPNDVAYGSYNTYGPIFIPKEGITLGEIEGMPYKPGLVVKKNTDWTSVFSVAPAIPANLLRGIASHAGMTITNPYEGDITHASGRFVAVHTLDGGDRRLQFAQKEGKVRELVSGKTYTLQSGYIIVPMSPRSSYIFFAQ